jgi:hypothetical protein
MLDTFIKLIDKVVELLRYRTGRRGRRFSTLVDPFYENLKAIHKDYLQFFEDTHARLLAGRELSKISADFSKRRIIEESQRMSVIAQAEVLSREHRVEDLREFFKAVNFYFYVQPLSSAVTPSTVLELAMRRASLITVDSQDSRVRLQEAIEVGMNALRENWRGVSAVYASLRARTVE